MRYHLLSLHLFDSFSIIFRACEYTKGSFSWLCQSWVFVSKGFKYVQSGDSMPFIMLTRLVFMQFSLVLPQSSLSVSWTFNEVLI